MAVHSSCYIIWARSVLWPPTSILVAVTLAHVPCIFSREPKDQRTLGFMLLNERLSVYIPALFILMRSIRTLGITRDGGDRWTCFPPSVVFQRTDFVPGTVLKCLPAWLHLMPWALSMVYAVILPFFEGGNGGTEFFSILKCSYIQQVLMLYAPNHQVKCLSQ